MDTGENWSVEMGNYSPIRLEGNLSGNGSIGIGEEGWLAICGSDGSLASFKISFADPMYSSPQEILVEDTRQLVSIRGLRQILSIFSTEARRGLGYLWSGMETPPSLESGK